MSEHFGYKDPKIANLRPRLPVETEKLRKTAAYPSAEEQERRRFRRAESRLMKILWFDAALAAVIALLLSQGWNQTAVFLMAVVLGGGMVALMVLTFVLSSLVDRDE